MIEKSLLYIYTAGEAPRFVGCGVLVEGPHVATCRHVWRMATEAEGAEPDAVVIEFPYAYAAGAPVRIPARLADACPASDGPPADLVLLAPGPIPSGVLALQLAADGRYETGDAIAVVGLPGRGEAGAVGDATIEGRLAPPIRADGRRQFTGRNVAGFWLERGSSGSPVFLDGGQQLAGILSLSELGANAGKSHLHEAFVVRGQTIREHVRRLAAQPVARAEQVSAAELRDILAAEGMHDVPTHEIPARLRQFLAESRAHAALPAAASNQTDIDAVVGAARRLVGDLKPEEALTLLRTRRDEERQAHARRQVPLLRETLAVQRITFDHDGTRATLEEIAQLDPDDAWVHFEIGDSWMLAGDLVQARSAYGAGRDAAARTGDARDLSVSHNKVGDVLLAQGEGPAALDAYRAGLAIRETLARRDPANTQWQRDLSVSHGRIGDVLRAQGDGPATLDAYRAGLAIAETLARRDPANTEWQRDLSVSHDRIGDVLLAQGEGPATLDAYRAGLAIRETLARRDPANTQWQRDLSVSHNKVGDVLLAQGEGPAALDAYRAGLAIRKILARRDPANTQWQRDLFVSHNKVGDVLLAQGEGPAGRDAYRAGLAIAETLARRDPANAQWQRDLFVSHNKVGDVLLAQGEGPAALDAYRAGLAIAETLARRDPANTEWQRDLSVSHDRIGDVLLAQGEGPAALDAYRAGLAIAETLARRNPANTEWQRDLSVSHSKVGDVLLAQGEGPAALDTYRAGLAIRETLTRRDSANTEWQRDLIVSHVKLSEAAPAEAAHHLRRASEIVHRLHDTQRLAPVDRWMVADIDQRLAGL